MPAGLYSSSLKTSTAKLPQPVSLTSCMGSCKCALSNTWLRRYRESILGDQAILTGSTILTDELNIKLRRGTPDRLGSTGSDRHEGGRYLPEWQGGEGPIQARCERIRSVLINPTTGEYDRRSCKSILPSCTAVFRSSRRFQRVGFSKEKDRYNDALNATRASVEKGGTVRRQQFLCVLLSLLGLWFSSSARHSASSPSAGTSAALSLTASSSSAATPVSPSSKRPSLMRIGL